MQDANAGIVAPVFDDQGVARTLPYVDAAALERQAVIISEKAAMIVVTISDTGMTAVDA